MLVIIARDYIVVGTGEDATVIQFPDGRPQRLVITGSQRVLRDDHVRRLLSEAGWTRVVDEYEHPVHGRQSMIDAVREVTAGQKMKVK